MIIPGYDKGSDVLLLDTVYVRPRKLDDRKWTNGTLYLIHKDISTGQKKVSEINNPSSSVYITKEELRKNFRTQRAYLHLDEVDEYKVKYKNITKFIKDKIEEDGVDLEYLKLYDQAKKEVFKWRHSYYSDYDLCDYALTQAVLNYKPSSLDTTKSFLDIEVDVYGRGSYELDDAKCPIHAISMIFDHEPDGKKTKKPYVFTLLLRNHVRYKHQKEFEENLNSFIDKCHKEFDKKYCDAKYKIKVFDDESELLSTFHALVNLFNSDFTLIWNMPFDIPYIYKRSSELGYNPDEIFSHPDFSDKFTNYWVDFNYRNDLKNRCDYFDTTSYTRYMCQMSNYAGIRKGRADYGGNSLDNVAKLELKEQKREYSKPGITVINGAIEEYENFVLYSINDVWLQYALERRTNDTQVLFEQAYYGGTRISKTLKQSVYLKNVFAIEYFKLGIVPRNNKNINYSKYSNCDVEEDENTHDKLDLKGALVGNPELNEHTGVKIFGKRSKYLFELCMDFDYASKAPLYINM